MKTDEHAFNRNEVNEWVKEQDHEWQNHQGRVMNEDQVVEAVCRYLVFDRVAKGFYAAVCLRSKYGDEALIGLALPDEKMLRRYLSEVAFLRLASI